MAKDKKKEIKEKPLDKMTVVELRDIAKQIDGIIGVHGMNKPELLAAIKEERGIQDAPKAKSGDTTKQIKAKIKTLKVQRREALEAKNKVLATRYRRRISKLKKKTRTAA